MPNDPLVLWQIKYNTDVYDPFNPGYGKFTVIGALEAGDYVEGDVGAPLFDSSIWWVQVCAWKDGKRDFCGFIPDNRITNITPIP